MEPTSPPVVLLFALALATALPLPARAADVWTDPYPGVRHLHRTRSRVDLHVLLVDLTAPEVSLVTTRPSDRGLPVADFARQYDADIALNANYFDGAYRPCGLTAADGHAWTDAYEEECSASLGVGDLNQALAFDSAQTLRSTPQPWMSNIVSGKPWLVRDGVALTGWLSPQHIASRHPRTAVGLSRDRKTLVLIIADGRKHDAIGLDGDELAALMLEVGAWDAFNLDGGGSTELFVAGEGGVQNHPSDGRGRGVGNHLGIRIDRGARWYAARLESVSPPSAVDAGAHALLTATYRNVGRAPWTAGPHGGVVLSALSGRPSALWDPERWLSTTSAVPATATVASGALVTLALPAAAPVAAGEFREAFVPVLPGVGALAGARPAELVLAVRGEQLEADRARLAAQPLEELAAVPSRAEPSDAELAAQLAVALGTPYAEDAAAPRAVASPRHEASLAALPEGSGSIFAASAAGGLAMLAWSLLRRASLARSRRNVRRPVGPATIR